MKKSILLIEDDEDLIGLYSEVLSENYKLHIASMGNQGLEQALTCPDLILLDVLLPDINGFEVLKKLKHRDETKNIPVIVLTNMGSKEADGDKKLALMMGAANYLIKTYHRPQDIMSVINDTLKVSEVR